MSDWPQHNFSCFGLVFNSEEISKYFLWLAEIQYLLLIFTADVIFLGQWEQGAGLLDSTLEPEGICLLRTPTMSHQFQDIFCALSLRIRFFLRFKYHVIINH